MALKITFAITGKNSQNALTGDLTLLDGAAVVKKTTAFSGGKTFNPIEDGTYRLRLDVRGDVSTNEANTDGSLKPFYGIQQVGTSVKDSAGISWNMQDEWGKIRARLNPTGGHVDRGEYLHGKQRALDYTHGCVCDRSEVILNHLWSIENPPAVIDVVVSGAQAFDLETLIAKNFAKKA